MKVKVKNQRGNKPMEKVERVTRLTELKERLEMTPDEYVREWNERHPDERRPMRGEDCYPAMVGMAIAELDLILKGEVT